MKKQIFILVMAFFAVSSVFGQKAVTHTAAPLLKCANDALNPIAGKPYDYAVLSAGTGGKYLWQAGKDKEFIKASGLVTDSVLVQGASGLTNVSVSYNLPANTSNTTQITWSSASLVGTTVASPTFVSIYNSGNTDKCADNLKVYKITPVNGFTIDITSLGATATDTTGYNKDTYSTCMANIASARYSGTTMVYDYGENVLYYEVVAANFSGYWDALFQLTGLKTGQTAKVEWSYSYGGTYTTIATLTGNATGAVQDVSATVLKVETNETNTTSGVSVFIKVTVDHGSTFEGLTAEPIKLAVDGTDSAAQKDVLAWTCAEETAWANDALVTLNPRPTVATNTQNATSTGTLPFILP